MMKYIPKLQLCQEKFLGIIMNLLKSQWVGNISRLDTQASLGLPVLEESHRPNLLQKALIKKELPLIKTDEEVSILWPWNA